MSANTGTAVPPEAPDPTSASNAAAKSKRQRKRQLPRSPEQEHAVWLPPGAIGRKAPDEVPPAVRRDPRQLRLGLEGRT